MSETFHDDPFIPQKNYASILTRITSLYVDRLASAILKPMGLSLAEYKILYIAMAHPEERITSSFLEKHFQMSHSTCVGLLNHLEKDGWIHRVPNPDNHREKMVILSQFTQDQRQQLNEAGENLEQEFTANLSPQEAQEYIRLSKKIMR